MQAVTVCVEYMLWHYSRAFRDMLGVWMNVFWFVFHFFSVGLLLKTFFSPWKRVREEYHRTGFEDLAASILVNIVTRILGAIVRFCILLTALIVLLLLSLLFFSWLFFWVVAPVALVYSFLFGITLLI